MSINDRIRQAIKGSGKSVLSIAHEAHISPSALYDFTHGRRQLGTRIIQRLADHFGLELCPIARSK